MKNVMKDYENGFVSSIEFICEYRKRLLEMGCSDILDKQADICLSPLMEFIHDMLDNHGCNLSDFEQNKSRYDGTFELERRVQELEFENHELRNVISDIEGAFRVRNYSINEDGNVREVKKAKA